MPVLERLDWVEEQVHAGRSFRLSIGPALKDNTYKYKVLIWKCGVTSLSHKQMAISNINFLRDVFERSSVVDRGHQHSSGVSEVAFYVTPLRLGQSADLPPVPPPVEEPRTEQSPLLFTVPPAAQLPMFDTKVLDKIASLEALLYDHLQYVSLGIGNGTLQQLCDQQNLTIQTLQSRINFQFAWEQRLQETNQMLNQSYLNGAMSIISKLDSMAETICGINIISKIDSMAATLGDLQECVMQVQCTFQSDLDHTTTRLPGRISTGGVQQPLVATQGVTNPTAHLSNRIDKTVQAVVATSEMCTNVTARMLFDEMVPEETVGQRDQEIHQGSDHIDSDAVSSSTDEEFVSLPTELRQASSFWQKRVFVSDSGKGTVIDLVRGSSSGQIYYVVKYDDGSSDWLLRDEIKQQSAAYEERRKKGATSTKTSSSSSRRR